MIRKQVWRYLGSSPPSDVKRMPASRSHPGWATFLLGTVTRVRHIAHAGWMIKRAGKDSPTHPCGSDGHVAEAPSTKKKSNGWGSHSSRTVTLRRTPKASGHCRRAEDGRSPGMVLLVHYFDPACPTGAQWWASCSWRWESFRETDRT